MEGYKDKLKSKWGERPAMAIPSLGVRDKAKSLVGRGGDSTTARTDHVSQPLTSLRDPSSFGPPPRRVGTGSSGRIDSPPPPPSRTSSNTSYSSQQDPPCSGQPPHCEEEAPPSRPYRADTTGLSTTHLPPPPRRDGILPPPPLPSGRPTPPSLPPRLPPRSNAASPTLPTRPTPPPEAVSSIVQPSKLNQSAINRLGAAGISVPALGIGSRQPASPPPLPPARSSAAPTATNNPSQLNELQSRFSRLSSSESTPPDQGTTMDQKRAALQTAAALRQNPSSVSASDAMAAASTFNNFRQRHGEQVAAGVRSANSLQEKYGGQITMHDNDDTSRARSGGQEQGRQVVAAAAGFIGKKKPPPPPPKKFFTNPRGGDDPPPPPVPLATRPQF
ncbi:hypothetical protein B0T25DRAFT_142435 [Lasiosphaeria hispida]|uniref:Uncharacterized protein n=1 Tax=Lasiosphaeria hispida TaxID=260671 RepID=A0AAJ0HL82_9PEZI|nr:hypothetical protein B0T25DRAFT_142435 [Lasiosphaeria hispida]